LVVHAAATRLTKDAVYVDQDLCSIIDDSDTPFNVNQCCRMGADGCCGDFRRPETRIPYSYLIYALGSHLPPPIATSAVTKKELMSFLKVQQAMIYNAKAILIIGGGVRLMLVRRRMLTPTRRPLASSTPQSEPASCSGSSA
jgi:hypothetical protein